MKLTFFQFVFAILFTNSVLAMNPVFYLEDSVKNISCKNQVKEKTISIGIVLSHFSPTKKGRDASSQTSLFNLGGESLINVNLKNELSLSTGLYYQFGKIETTFVKERTIFGEISIPVLVNIPLTHSDKNRLNISTGLYLGQYINVKKEIGGDKLMADNGWHELPPEYIEGYSSERLITDIYFGLGYREFENKNGFFQFNLHSKYRLNEHWLNQEVSKLIIGIKITHFFKL